MSDAPIRPLHRPRWSSVIWRGILTTLWLAVGLWVAAWILPGFSIDSAPEALLAGLVIGLLNAVIWPALSFVLVPISVLTLGIGAILVDALAVWWILDNLPGVHIDGFFDALLIVIGLVVLATLVTAVQAIDDGAMFDNEVRSLARRRRKGATVTEVPGIVFVQIDGVAKPVLERAMRGGDVPTLHRWVNDGQHRLVSWTTGWSSQTGVSQCGILHGSTENMPAFRWVDKSTGEIVVSNRPASAAAIEQAHPTATACSPTTGRATATCSPATPSGRC